MRRHSSRRNAATAALQAGTDIPVIGLIALALLPLFYPLADIVHWQRLAAAEKNRKPITATRRPGLRRCGDIFRIYAVESPLLWLFIASLGRIAVAAMAMPDGTNAMQAFVQSCASGDNPIAAAAFSLLLIAIAAIALSTMSAALSAGLCTIRYDMLPRGRKAEAPAASPAASSSWPSSLALIMADTKRCR